MQKKISKIFCVFLAALTFSSCLTGCSSQEETQVIEIPYDPYEFTPREFVEEGGWDAAYETIKENLPKLYCFANNVVLDAGDYSSILTESGNTYDFDNATLQCVTFSRPITDDITLKNWVDCAFTIPVIGQQNAFVSLTVEMQDIVRMKDGTYTCINFAGLADTDAGLSKARDNVTNYANYVVNDGEIKETLDYGLIYCNVPEDITEYAPYESMEEYTTKIEEERIKAYLLALEDYGSVYFSTSDKYEPTKASDYTETFDENKIMSDLVSMSHLYGLNVIQDEKLPVTKRQRKKSTWTAYDIPYTLDQPGKDVQDYFRETIRNVYIFKANADVAFRIDRNPDENKVLVTVYVRQIGEGKNVLP